MVVSFVRFGTAHLCVIALTFITPLILAIITRGDASGNAARVACWSWAAFLVINKIVGLTVLRRYGELTAESALPMHLCDWAAIVSVVTLIYPNQWTYELCYFWALGGTLQALLTPDLVYGFPDPRFVSFFALHGGVIASALYVTLAMGMRPLPISILRVLAWSTLYVGAAMAMNTMLGTNFGYLHAKPTQPSLLDFMAPWPFYILQLVPVAIAFTLFLYAPFFVIDWLRLR